MSKHLKNIGVISILTVVSRMLGLMRDQLGAAIFGASILNSAFISAFRLPNLFRRLLGEGTLIAAFLPLLQGELHERGRAGAFAFVNQVLSWLLVVSASLVALAMVVFSHARLVPHIADKWYLYADLTVLLFPYLVFVCLAAVLNATLNVLQRFTEPALSPIWLNLAMILSLGGAGYHFAKTPMGEIHWLCAGVLVGGFFQAAVPAVVLMREGWNPRFHLVLSPGVRAVAALMAPGLFGSAIYQINVNVSSLIGYSLNDWAGTILFYSNRLMELPIGVFAIAVSTVVYPLIAKHAVERNFTAMAEDYRKGLRLILVINLPAAVGLALLSEPIVRVLYQHGEFKATDTALMAPLLVIFVVGMPFFSIVNLTLRAFYAVKDTTTPVKVAVVDFTVNLVLSLVLMRLMGVAGLVVSTTVAIMVQTILLQIALVRRFPQMSFRPLWPSLSKAMIGAAVMGLVVWSGWQFVRSLPAAPLAVSVIALVTLIPLGVGVYGGALWLLKIEGKDDLIALVKRRKSRAN